MRFSCQLWFRDKLTLFTVHMFCLPVFRHSRYTLSAAVNRQWIKCYDLHVSQFDLAMNLLRYINKFHLNKAATDWAKSEHLSSSTH